MNPAVLLKRSLIFIHRWLGVSLCVLFLLWFPSGIVMMYWGFPSVSDADRLERSPALDPAAVKLSPSEAFVRLGLNDQPGDIRLNTFDGRPVYRFDGQIVYADTGEEQVQVPTAMAGRVAAAWVGQPAAAATVDEITQVDQWTVQRRLRNLSPLWKYSWPNGEQVYVSGASGEVIQYTTTASRLAAYAGAIPHWFYFTPLRKNGPQWNRVVIWTSGIGTIAAIIGLVIGIWMYSPSKRYRYAGAPTSIPYRGQKRWHAILGLVFGAGAVTWAFSGLLSMDPFPQRTNRPAGGGEQIGRSSAAIAQSIPAVLRSSGTVEEFTAKHPRDVLAALATLDVKELQLASFDTRPFYLATLAGGDTLVVPIDGQAAFTFDVDRIIALVKEAAGPALAEIRTIHQYDRYYLDRRRERPLPVVLVRLDDEQQTRYYIDPKTARIVGGYSSDNWMSRWVYHGLHSLDFPWLYDYRPLWDIVVIAFMIGGTALCVTSLILAWRVLGRTLRALLPGRALRSPALNEDLDPV